MTFARRVTKYILSVLLCGAAAFGSTASAKQFKYAIGFPPGSYNVVMAEDYAKRVKAYTQGRHTVRVFPMTLLNMAETSAGLRDGIADIGFLLTPYFPAEYPHANLVNEASMMLRLMGDEVRGKEASAFVGALTEFTFFNCVECHQEFAKQNSVYTGHVGGSSYGLICNKPVKNEADLKGKRLRSGAANWSRWSTAVGASPITMSANEMREALSQGVVDCIILSTPEIHNFGLMEAVTDITMAVPGGIFSTAGFNMNTNAWRSLSVDDRKAFLRAAAEGGAYTPWIYQQKEGEILAEAKKKGVRLHDADPALVKKTQAFIEQDMGTISKYFADKHGVKRGEQMITTFRPILQKWVKLVQPVTSQDQLGQLYWDEIYSKVDVTKHGMQTAP
ncbi:MULTISPECIES: C4-dicarboxylate TRAP transporter substrate-binding protein [Noviherbaspirillum]|uniref:C4-dicarboxylate TRAP transporter substrate-binding protein n=1 Tax=Noviherbaspirillum TaxID=1344552 RepID=UPI00124D0CC7|nr:MULTISPECIES: C4-dicarboxylate TRAP transporter substrate-binding protein [Noviherbaspirillum]